MVEVRHIEGKAEEKIWIQLQNKMYADCEQHVPTLDYDERNTFKPGENPALEFCECERFLAWKDGKAVGRVAAIINKRANELFGNKKVRFGWIDFADDIEVSKALLDAVAKWGKERGMTEMNGPLGFTDWDKEGALVEGYEYLPPMASLYNYPYYIEHYEKYGLKKENDWIEFQVYPPKQVPERWLKVAKIVEARKGLHVVKVKNVGELKRRYPNYEYMDVLDAAYQPLYNFVPMTEKQKKYYAAAYFGMLNFDMVTFVENEKNELVALGLGMPDISKALRKANGSLFPFGWYHILKALKAKRMDVWNFLLIGVRPDYQDSGAHTLIFCDQIPILNRMGVHHMETTSMMETNRKVLGAFEGFDHIQHKRRRAYVKEI